jgi:hypothetical protein
MNEENEEKCCVCGESATRYHMSIFGQIKYWVCEKHYQKTRPAIGPDGEYNRMGLVDYDTREWVELKHWKENQKT